MLQRCQTTVGSRKLEHWPGTIEVGFPSSQACGVGGQSFSNFLVSTVKPPKAAEHMSQGFYYGLVGVAMSLGLIQVCIWWFPEMKYIPWLVLVAMSKDDCRAWSLIANTIVVYSQNSYSFRYLKEAST